MSKATKSFREESAFALGRRKAVSRAYLRLLPVEEKVRQAIALQERYYAVLLARQANGGKPIPIGWQKWYKARHNCPRSES